MDYDGLPKMFCENVNLSHGEECVLLCMQSGENGTTYSLTPKHAKRLQMALTWRISQYEAQYGTIHTEWSPYSESPIQRDDIKAGTTPPPRKGKKDT